MATDCSPDKVGVSVAIPYSVLNILSFLSVLICAIRGKIKYFDGVLSLVCISLSAAVALCLCTECFGTQGVVKKIQMLCLNIHLNNIRVFLRLLFYRLDMSAFLKETHFTVKFNRSYIAGKYL